MGRVARRDREEPACRQVKFEATDAVELYGLLYEPRRKSKRAIIFLHGTGGASVFESRRSNLLGSAFARNRFAYFAFNNRGAHLMKRLRRSNGRLRDLLGGMAYERIRDCVHDIDGAIRELKSRGYQEFTLVGHSTGANKIGVYDFYRHRNPVANYVFAGGADDVGLMYDQLGARKFQATLERARQRRTSEELLPFEVSIGPMSWRAFYDMCNPDGDYNVFPFREVMKGAPRSRKPKFRHLRGISKPSLFIYGEHDEFLPGGVTRHVETLGDALAPKPNFEIVVMKDADHGFGRREDELAQLIVDWLGN